MSQHPDRTRSLSIRRGAWAFGLLAIGFACSSLPATQLRRLGLEEMTARAETVFSGRCVAVREVFDPRIGRKVTRITFHVDRAVKGERGGILTIRQFGGDPERIGQPGSVVGLPRFQPGEEVVLFLYGESSLGLRSPVGFGQGKFSIVEDKQGRRRAINEFGNVGLFDRISAAPGRELDPTTLLDMVESLVRP